MSDSSLFLTCPVVPVSAPRAPPCPWSCPGEIRPYTKSLRRTSSSVQSILESRGPQPLGLSPSPLSRPYSTPDPGGSSRRSTTSLRPLRPGVARPHATSPLGPASCPSWSCALSGSRSPRVYGHAFYLSPGHLYGCPCHSGLHYPGPSVVRTQPTPRYPYESRSCVRVRARMPFRLIAPASFLPLLVLYLPRGSLSV